MVNWQPACRVIMVNVNRSTLERISFLFVCLILALSALWIGRGVYRFSYLQMDMDEALHANRGLDFTSAVRRGDLPALWQSFAKPEWYPPGHGLLLSAWFMLAGASVETARLYSTFCYILFGLLLWFSTRELLPLAHPLIYLLPPLFLLADRLYSLNAALSMLELPAITLAFGALFCNIVAWRKNSRRLHLLALLFALLCLLTRYNYGLVVIPVLAGADLLRLWPQFPLRQVSAMGRGVLAGWAVLVLLVGFWFIGLDQWRWFFDYASLPLKNYDLWSLENWLYYPQQLWNVELGWLAILLSIVAVGQAIRLRRGFSGVFLYLAFFLLGLAMLTFRLYKISRFGMLITPSLWVMAAVGAEQLVSLLPRDTLRLVARLLLLVGVLGAAIYNLYHFQSRLALAYENRNDGADQAYRFIGESLDITDQRALELVMLGRTDQWSGQALRFNLETRCMENPGGCQVTVLDSREIRLGWPEQEFTEQEQNERMARALDQADLLVLFSENQEEPTGWQLIAARRFNFERQARKPSNLWVSIYQR